MPETYDDQMLLEYIEGDLPTEKRGQVDRWIQDDPHLALMVRKLIHDRDELRNLYDPEPPNWIMLEVDQHLERAMLLGQTRRDGEQFTRHHRSALAAVMLCGALAAILAVVSTVVFSILNQDQQGPEIATGDPTLPQRLRPENTPEPPVAGPDVVVQVPVPPVVPDPVKPSVEPTPVVTPVTPDKPVVVAKDPTVPTPDPVTPKPPVPPAVNASVGDAAPADMLQLPAALRPQIKDRDAVIHLSEKVAAEPGLITGYELRIETRDPVSTASALNALSAQSIKSDELFLLEIPADRLVHAVRTLRDDRQHAYVWFAPRTEKAKVADQAWSADWPAIKPDYANLLRRQLEAAGLLGSSALKLPVVITKAAAAGAATPAAPEVPAAGAVPAKAPESDAKKLEALIKGRP